MNSNKETRQSRRDKGRYRKYYPGSGLCEFCLKSVKESERWESTSPHVECLHEKCLKKLSLMAKSAAEKFIKSQSRKWWAENKK